MELAAGGVRHKLIAAAALLIKAVHFIPRAESAT
jgi:hypothetical protein